MDPDLILVLNLSGRTDLTITSEKGKNLFNIELKRDNNSDINDNLAQLCAQNIGLMVENTKLCETARPSIFSALVRGLHFNFYEIKVNPKYFIQMTDNKEAITEKLTIDILGTNLDISKPEERFEIISILTHVKSKIIQCNESEV